jgi:uncharacterized protein (TIGR00725 family)
MSDEQGVPGARRLVGVLGSAGLPPDDPRYARARELGRLLASAGHAVATGGYGGLMAAVSEGAASAGGHVVGLPVRRWTELRPNPWVAEARWADDHVTRLGLLARCDALVALEGGVGTLAEVAVTWASRQTDPEITPPLLLVGPLWAELLPVLGRSLLIDPRQFGLVRLVPAVGDVPSALRLAWGEAPLAPWRRG